MAMNARISAAVLLSAILFVAPAAAEPSTERIPSRVSKFIARRELCDNFRGGEPKEVPKSKRGVSTELQDHCVDTDSELKALRHDYSDNPAIMQRLSKYDCAKANCGEQTAADAQR